MKICNRWFYYRLWCLPMIHRYQKQEQKLEKCFGRVSVQMPCLQRLYKYRGVSSIFKKGTFLKRKQDTVLKIFKFECFPFKIPERCEEVVHRKIQIKFQRGELSKKMKVSKVKLKRRRIQTELGTLFERVSLSKVMYQQARVKFRILRQVKQQKTSLVLLSLHPLKRFERISKFRQIKSVVVQIIIFQHK